MQLRPREFALPVARVTWRIASLWRVERFPNPADCAAMHSKLSGDSAAAESAESADAFAHLLVVRHTVWGCNRPTLIRIRMVVFIVDAHIDSGLATGILQLEAIE